MIEEGRVLCRGYCSDDFEGLGLRIGCRVISYRVFRKWDIVLVLIIVVEFVRLVWFLVLYFLSNIIARKYV